jgi:chorismate mutase / prephenate dehydratase
MTIADWRVQIDDVDNELLRLLNERAKLASKIGRLKQDTNLPLNDEDRERSLLARLCAANDGPLDDPGVSKIFRQIINETRRVEARVLVPRAKVKETAPAKPERG